MTIDIETMLDRGAFCHPVFAEFFLDKYRDIKETDPDAAKKIEERVFTPEFLKTLLDGESRSLKIRALRRVPHERFAGLGEDIAACMADPEAPGGVMAAAKVLKELDPERFQKTATGVFDKAMAESPVSARSFSWLGFFHDLPRDLQERFFDRSFTLLLENLEDLSDGRRWVLVKSLEAALCLRDSRSPVLAVKVVSALLDTYDPEDSGYYQFCFDLFRFLTPVPDGDRDDFELDLFFHLDTGNVDGIPEVVNHLYTDGPDGLTFSGTLADFHGKGAPADFGQWTGGEDAPERFLTAVFREIFRDQALMDDIRENDLARGMAATFLCLAWQEMRGGELSPEEMADADLVDYLTLDTRQLPFMDRLRSFVGSMDGDRRGDVLTRAMETSLKRWKTQGTGFYSLVNIIRLMSDSADPDYLPLVVQSLRWPIEEEDDRFYENIINGVCRFGEPVFDALDLIVGEIRKDRLLDVLSVIRRIPGPRAEDFLMTHVDLFTAASRSDTLDTFRMLASRRGLDLVAHKVGKDQPGIDELFAIVSTFEGNDGPEVRQALEAAAGLEQKFREQYAAIEKNLPRDVMRLELECTRCGDRSFYDCSNILVSPRGEGYVAEELTCINCGRISEFGISAPGQYAVQAEMMRVFGGQKEEDEMPLPGAVKVMNSAFFGRTMSIKEGISLYREKIQKEPKAPDHYIGLGNAYRSVNQVTLARQQYEKAIDLGPFYVEAYLSLARLDDRDGASESALAWLEKGRPFLKRPLICRGMQVPAEKIMEGYRDLHFDLVKKTGSKVAMIRDSECMAGRASLKKIGPNEKCPCGSGKKYKKCCKRKH